MNAQYPCAQGLLSLAWQVVDSPLIDRLKAEMP